MKYEGVKNIIRAVSRKIVEAGSHTKTRGYYEYHEQYHHFFRCMGFLGGNAIEGDVFEYGVADGSSILMLNEIVNELLKQRENKSPRIFGFDSFEGLPEATGIDKDHHVNESGPGVKFNKGGYGCLLERVQNKLNKRIGNTDHISLIKGWYDKTLTDELKSSMQTLSATPYSQYSWHGQSFIINCPETGL